MIQSFYNFSNSLIQQQRHVNVISHNVSNANTDGYKREHVDFKEAIYISHDKMYADTRGTGYEVGHGTIINSVKKEFTSGGLKQTAIPTDIAVQGEGFLSMVDAEGNVSYSRGGSFNISIADDGQAYLIDSSGRRLADMNGNAVAVNSQADLSINTDGIMSLYGQPGIVLGFYRFDNPAMLEVSDGSIYKPTDQSGQPEMFGTGKVLQGYLETSNVDMGQEMTNMIMAQRLYQMSAKGIQTVDEMQSTANRMRR